ARVKFLTELLVRTPIGKTVEFSHLLESPWDLTLKWPRNILLRNGVTLEDRRGRFWREGVPRIRINFACSIQFLRLLESTECFAEVFPVLAVGLAGWEMVSVEKHFRLGDESGAIRLRAG